ncbi:MAG TPA: ATP-binding protein, partial [Dehalococcoidales bacterium]|nr:ATP-binding protein [Dehalococcoidales bacterium]
YWKYPAGIGIVGIATILSWLLRSSLDPPVLVTFFLIGVIISAIYFGLGPSIIASIASVLIFDYLFVPPTFTFAIADFQYALTMVALLAVSIIISYFTSRLQNQTNAARRHEQQMTTLYALGKELAVLNDMDSYIHAIMKSAADTFGTETMIFLPDDSKARSLMPHLHGTAMAMDENERAAATWAFEHQKEVGYGTDTLPEAKARYVPLTTARSTVGVLALAVTAEKKALTVDQEQLLGAYADLAAVAIEGILLTEESRKVQIIQTTEKLQTALLNSISHDLRTPLVAIIGTLSSLKDESMQLDETARKNLIDVALQEGDRLNRLLSNLLDMSRIEAGALKLSLETAEIQDLLGSALEQLGNRRGNHTVNIDIPADLPYITVDSGLIVQAFSNVLDNAFKYSPSGAPVEVTAQRNDNTVLIEIADRGEGIPAQDLDRVFDKFYRLQRRDGVAGTGLGLSIVKGIIESHGGHVSASNRTGGGTEVKITLPINQEPEAK